MYRGSAALHFLQRQGLSLEQGTFLTSQRALGNSLFSPFMS